MKKPSLNLLIFIFLFALSCSDDPAIPSPSGDCRVAKIIYEGDNESFERSFKYNAEGLLIEYNNPVLGTPTITWKTVLAYDVQQRLISIKEMRGNELDFELHYTYKTPLILEGTYKHYLSDYDGTMLLYYNTENQLDSARWVSNDNDEFTNDTNTSKITYENGNIISGIVANDPCCTIFTVTEASYDDGINPNYLLKKATNNLGLININQMFPISSALASVNNRLKYKWTWASHNFPGDPHISIHQVSNYEFFYEYYENSPYLELVRSSTNGVPDPGKTTFIYEACK